MNPSQSHDGVENSEYEWLPPFGPDRLQQLQQLAHALGLFEPSELNHKSHATSAHNNTGAVQTAAQNTQDSAHIPSRSPSSDQSGGPHLFPQPLSSPNLAARALLSPGFRPLSSTESDESPQPFALNQDYEPVLQSRIMSPLPAGKPASSDATYESVDCFFSWSKESDSPRLEPWQQTQMAAAQLLDSAAQVGQQMMVSNHNSSLVVSPGEEDETHFASMAHSANGVPYGSSLQQTAPPHETQPIGVFGGGSGMQMPSSIQSQFVHPASYQGHQITAHCESRPFTPADGDIVYTPVSLATHDNCENQISQSHRSQNGYYTTPSESMQPRQVEDYSFKDIRFNQLQNIEFKHHRARRTFKNLPPDAAQNACYFTVPSRQPDERKVQNLHIEDDIKKRRNREAVQTFRQRKKEQIIDMEVKISSYERLIVEYERKIRQLEEENRQLNQRLYFYESKDPEASRDEPSNNPGSKRKIGALLMVIFVVSFLFTPSFFMGPPVTQENEGSRYIGRALMGHDGGIVAYPKSVPTPANKMVYYMSSPTSMPSMSLPDGREQTKCLPHRRPGVEETQLSQSVITTRYEQENSHKVIDSAGNQTSLIKSIRSASVTERDMFQIKDTGSSYIFCNDAYRISTQHESSKNSVLSLLIPASILSANESTADPAWNNDTIVQVTCQILDIRVINPTSTPIVSDGNEST